ncbi:MAG: 2-phosphosulfolactate phosphatase [Gemmatimonadetes bacterium]|nr:2-phosphosulfolactate phosphatase [Gemmatimonadota bacterium]
MSVRVDVYFGPATLPPSEWQGRVVVVIDVLRASTTMATALAHGARAIIPFESADDAVARFKSFDRSEVLLAGERRMARISGFDLGNSPAEFTREVVEGKTILMTTTNGTAALMAVQGATEIVLGAFVNLSATVAVLRHAIRNTLGIAVVCAGSERQFAMEDAVCAGRMLRAVSRRLATAHWNDAARAVVALDRRYGKDIEGCLRDTVHGRALAEAGFSGDVALAAALDTHAIVPVYAERQVTPLGRPRRR